MAAASPYQRAVQDYKNSVDAQQAALKYNDTTRQLTHTYNEILDTISSLYGKDGGFNDPRENVAKTLNKYTTSLKTEQNDELKQELVDTDMLKQAVNDYEKASSELEDYQLKFIDRKQENNRSLTSEIDTKTKLVFLNEQAFNKKNVIAGIMQTTLFYLVLVCVLFYASFIRILSTSSLNWMLAITLIVYIVTVVRKWFAVQLYTFEFNILSWIMPSRMQKQCSARGLDY